MRRGHLITGSFRDGLRHRGAAITDWVVAVSPLPVSRCVSLLTLIGAQLHHLILATDRGDYPLVRLG